MAEYSQKQSSVTSRMLGHDEVRLDADSHRQSLPLEEQKFMSCMGGAMGDIFLACIAATMPILLLSVLLLALVFKYRIDTSETSYPELQSPLNNTSFDQVYFVNYSATRLMTVASWSSSVACLLTFFIMTLASYPLARQVLHSSRDKPSTLPTPYQLSLLLGALNANLGSLFSWTTYSSWKGKFPTTRVVKLAFVTFTFSSIVSYAIVACDTWLHVTTSTVVFPKIDRSAGTTSLGRGIYADSCAVDNATIEPCSVRIGAADEWLIGAPEAFRVLNNISETSFVNTFFHEGKKYTYLADANMPQGREYTATGIALTTSCIPVSESCKLEAQSGQTTPFNCSSAFYGDITQRNISGTRYGSETGIQHFTDAQFSKRVFAYTVPSNPFFFGAWALVPVSELGGKNPLDTDNGVVVAGHGGYAWVLGCTATVYNLKYAWVNGQFSHVQSLTPSNATMARIIAAPWFIDNYNRLSLTNAAYLATLQTNSTALASVWADQFSASATALSAGVMSSRQTVQEQQRHDMLVARVMKAPLWCMITLNLVFVVMGIILTFVALAASREQNVMEVQTRLSTVGLVGALFEGAHSERAVKEPDEWFSERDGRGARSQRRVGVGETQTGGFGFVVKGGW